MATSINPMPDYVVVQTEKSTSKTAGGLYLPDSAKEKPQTAKVVAVGAGLREIKPGDRILYKNEYEATTVKVDGEDYIVVSARNIIATVK